MADPKPHIFDGTKWLPLQGEDGAPGPTVVSADAGNVAKLGTDGRISVQPADMDSRWVNVTGDTMTGNLTIERDGGPGASAILLDRYSDASNAIVGFRKTRGTKAAQVPLQVNDTIGRITFGTINSAGGTVSGGLIETYVSQAPTAAGIGTTVRMVTAGLVGGVFTTFIASLDHTGLFSAEKAAFQLLDFAIATSFTGICDFKDPIGITQTDADAYSGITVDRRVSGVGASVSVTSDGRGAATRDIAYYGRITATSGAANNIGLWIDNEGMGGGQNIGLYVHNVLPEGPNNYVLYSVSPAQSSLAGKLGLNFLVPTHQLEVGGDTMLRGTLEVTGNITSTGTAHAFASKSIPGMAVIGSTATAITAASGGNPGGIRWDEDFLYIRTATAWKKVALTAV